MILGLVIFSWDQKIGSILDFKYPNNLKLSDHLINKIYMTHAYDENFDKDELIEISYDNQTILSYCDKSRVAEVGYEIVTLIIEEKEKLNLFSIKKQFLEFSKDIIKKKKDKRKDFFQNNIDKFFKKTTTKKILLLGRAGTGKTSIKKIIFEGINPKDLIYSPLEPTRGISPSVYSWLDLTLGLFDTSGQELDYLLENKNDNDHVLAFEGTDIIIYLFDYPTWISNQQEILRDIKRISDDVKEKSFDINIKLFIHKIDLIKKEDRKNELSKITKLIKNQFNYPIFYTSIYPNLIYSLYNAFYDILSSFSRETIYLKEVLNDLINDIPKTLIFITNENDNIIAQAMSKDFNTTIINHSHKLVAQLIQTFEEISLNDNIEHLIISGSMNLNIIMNYLNLQRFNLKNLICISQTLSTNKLIGIVGQIRMNLTKLYYLNSKK